MQFWPVGGARGELFENAKQGRVERSLNDIDSCRDNRRHPKQMSWKLVLKFEFDISLYCYCYWYHEVSENLNNADQIILALIYGGSNNQRG